MKISSKRKLALEQNWLIYRLRGMNSVLTPPNTQILTTMLPTNKQHLIYEAEIAIRELVFAVQHKRIKK